MLSLEKSDITRINEISNDRVELWINTINKLECTNMLEIGVYNGDFAAKILSNCGKIGRYFMIDPWKNLKDWNKPLNEVDFKVVYDAMMLQTDFAKEKRVILKGRTSEVIDLIEDNSLDFIYIDGDHTLKGITIDLLNAWRKLKKNGFIGGDDFTATIWQHDSRYEPSFVFPYAVYFANAVNAEIFALSYDQFLIKKVSSGFQFYDLTGMYSDTSVKNQLLE